MACTDLDAALFAACGEFCELIVPKLKQACEAHLLRRENALNLREQVLERREQALTERERWLGANERSCEQRTNALAGAQSLCRDLFKSARVRSNSGERSRTNNKVAETSNLNIFANVPSPSRALRNQGMHAEAPLVTPRNEVSQTSFCSPSPGRLAADYPKAPVTRKYGAFGLPADPGAALDSRQDSVQRCQVEGPDLRCVKLQQPQRCDVEVVGTRAPLSQRGEVEVVATKVFPLAATVVPNSSTKVMPTLRRATVGTTSTSDLGSSVGVNLDAEPPCVSVEDRKRLFMQQAQQSSRAAEVCESSKQRGRSVPSSRDTRTVDDEPAPRRELADLLRLDEEQRLIGVRRHTSDE